jgi:RNA polymerase sigma factor (sigma-70 family)
MRGLATSPDDPESSMGLLRRAQAGDEQAMNDLLARHIPRLQRWATGRLPVGIRTMNDTGDIVQEAVIKALKHFSGIELCSEGAFQAYLRKAVHNRIIDQYRRVVRRPPREEIPESAAAPGRNPFDAAAAVEELEHYERALDTLSEEDREAIVQRVEFELNYDELAVRLGKPSAAAARMAVKRAIVRLAKAMCRAR